MKEYTTAEAAELVGDISADRVRQIVKAQIDQKTFVKNVDYKMFGRTIVLTEQGVEKVKNRDKKPGPKGPHAVISTNGSKK